MQEPKDLKGKTKKLVGFVLRNTAPEHTSISGIRDGLEEEQEWSVLNMFETGASLSEVREYLDDEYPVGCLSVVYNYGTVTSGYLLPDSYLQRCAKTAKLNVRRAVKEEQRRTQDKRARQKADKHALYTMLYAEFGGKTPEECKPKS